MTPCHSRSPRVDLGRDRAWQPAARTERSKYRSWRCSAVRRLQGCVALSVTIYICYHFAKRTIALLGDNGVNVVVRLSAFILLCIGIQVLWTGYSGLVVVR